MISKRHFIVNKKFYCIHPESIENYEKAIADKNKIWVCHHRLETHNSDGEKRLVELSPEELQALGMYFNRPANELIFMTPTEHKKLHCSFKSFKNKMSKIMKGNKNAVGNQNTKGKHWKKGHLSEEHKKKLSETAKGKHWRIENGKRIYY